MGIGAPLKAMNTEAEGGCTITSAPTPSMRRAVSVSNPLVRPTMIRTSVTSTPTAMTLISVRTGRWSTFCKIILRIKAGAAP